MPTIGGGGGGLPLLNLLFEGRRSPRIELLGDRARATSSLSSTTSRREASALAAAAATSLLCLWVASRQLEYARRSFPRHDEREEEEERAPASIVERASAPRAAPPVVASDDGGALTTRRVGVVSSVYRLCVGTPRQGSLAPHSRGRIDLDLDVVAPDSLDSLDEYSHAWIVFYFHLNSNARKRSLASSSGGGERRFPSKVAPPALGGRRVGLFATRTPHRPNPVGVSLCRVDKVDKTKGVVHVSGLDLVDGTPVLDIKPYVPHYDGVGDGDGDGETTEVVVPEWVSAGLARRRSVGVSARARAAIRRIVRSGGCAPLYGTDEADVVEACVVEVLGVDVRSAFQTKRSRRGASRAHETRRVRERWGTSAAGRDGGDGLCTQQLDNLLLRFSVRRNDDRSSSSSWAEAAEGSGCDDRVWVTDVKRLGTDDDDDDDDRHRVNEEEGVYESVWDALTADVATKSLATTTPTTSPSSSSSSNPEDEVPPIEEEEEEDKEDGPGHRSPGKNSGMAVLLKEKRDTLRRQPRRRENQPSNSKVVKRASTTPKFNDYKSLRSYWADASAANTPEGLDFAKQQS